MSQRKPGLYDPRRLRDILLQKAERNHSLKPIIYIKNFLEECFLYFVIDKNPKLNPKFAKMFDQIELRVAPRWYDPCYWHVKFYGELVYVGKSHYIDNTEYLLGHHAKTGESLLIDRSTIITRKSQLELI